MARYLVAASYTSEGVGGLLKEGGTGRRAALAKAVEGMGGALVTFDYAFGKDDVFAIVELPDHVAAAALGLAVASTGLVSVRTVVLLSPEEIDQAVARVGQVAYRGPGRS